MNRENDQRTPRDPKALPDCLTYAGALGHPWCVTQINADGREQTRGEFNYGAEAAKWADELGQESCRIWQRLKKGKRRYKLVPYRAAALDGDV